MITAAIRTALCDLVTEAIGARKDAAETTPVYGYERFTRDQGALRVGYTDSGGALHGWHLRRVAEAQEEFAPDESYRCTITWRLVGMLALADRGESEIRFDDEIDGILDSLRRRWIGTDPRPRNSEVSIVNAAQLVDSGPVMFAGVLCHRAIIEITTFHLAAPGE